MTGAKQHNYNNTVDLHLNILLHVGHISFIVISSFAQ